MSLVEAWKSERRRKVWIVALLLLAPNLLGFLIFTLGPVLFSLGMSCTDWNLARHGAGTVPVRFVGLRNFIQLLGFHRHPQSPPTDHPLCWLIGFLILVLAVILLLYAVWRLRVPSTCADSNPSGRYFLLLIAGFVVAVSLFQTAWTDSWHAQPRLGVLWPIFKLPIAGACMGAFAVYVVRQESSRETRRLLRLALSLFMIVVLLRLIFNLSEHTFRIWEPNSSRFWYFLYNTVFLMMGLPLSVGGSLIMALLLHKTVEVSGWVRRLVLGALVLAVSFGGAFVLYRMRVGVSADFLALIMAVGLIAALGVVFGTTAFRTIFYLPSLSMSVATFVLWQKMFNPEMGPINAFLRDLFDTLPFQGLESFLRWWMPGLGEGWQLEPPQWLLDPAWSKPALIFMGVWGSLGSSNMLLYLAGLANVSPELYEAADIDGASKWQRFWAVTWPQLAPTTFFITVMGCIGGLQAGFEEARVMTNGGPAGSTTTLSYYLYTEAFEISNMGYGCAIAWVLFLIVFTLTIINWRFGNQMVNYE